MPLEIIPITKKIEFDHGKHEGRMDKHFYETLEANGIQTHVRPTGIVIEGTDYDDAEHRVYAQRLARRFLAQHADRYRHYRYVLLPVDEVKEAGECKINFV